MPFYAIFIYPSQFDCQFIVAHEAFVFCHQML